MGYQTGDEWIDNLGILVKLELTGKEREKAKEDMARMLAYIDQLKKVETEGAEPVSHVFPVSNVFREDEIILSDSREDILANAPKLRDGAIVVPKTIS